ncbi:NIPSNAP family protein [Pendulispora rubella]|uniref:NIPSNAP family protein n=1 Tax=Pendulispora rubella TaxID=2741070 RepID=A0ABZ2KYW1_9BACT
MATFSPFVELRQYTLRPGTRDTMIELFDREFVETQEAVGMKIIGQFRDLGDPNRFVWLRGFRDLDARAHSLRAFYEEGLAWKTHRESARATMVDTNDALLLHPARTNSGFALEGASRSSTAPKSLVTATLHSFAGPPGEDQTAYFERNLKPVLTAAGATILAYFVTDPSPNTYPRLPLREGEHAFVWFAHYADHAAALPPLPTWGRTQVLRLAPTARSLLR